MTEPVPSTRVLPKLSYLRTAAAWIVGIPWTMVMSTIALVGVYISGTGAFAHRISQIWSRVLLRIMGVKIQLHGAGNIPKDHSVLIVANHQSLCDILALSGYIPIRLSWIAKRELFRIPLLGPAMQKAGNIAIDRQNRDAAYKSLDEAAGKIKKFSVIIFPEGTRTRTGQVGRFKLGAVTLALNAKVPILPLTITNSFERMPPETNAVAPGTIHIYVDPEIPTSNMDKNDLMTLLEKLREKCVERVDRSYKN